LRQQESYYVKPVKHPGITTEFIISIPPQQNITYRI